MRRADAGGVPITTPPEVSPIGTPAAVLQWKTLDGAAGHLRFAPGETTKSVTVRLIDDAVHEADETFSLRLSGLTGTSGTPNGGTATILDDAAPATAPATATATQQPQPPQDDRSARRAKAGPAIAADWPRLSYRGLSRSGWVRLARRAGAVTSAAA